MHPLQACDRRHALSERLPQRPVDRLGSLRIEVGEQCRRSRRRSNRRRTATRASQRSFPSSRQPAPGSSSNPRQDIEQHVELEIRKGLPQHRDNRRDLRQARTCRRAGQDHHFCARRSPLPSDDVQQKSSSRGHATGSPARPGPAGSRHVSHDPQPAERVVVRKDLDAERLEQSLRSPQNCKIVIDDGYELVPHGLCSSSPRDSRGGSDVPSGPGSRTRKRVPCPGADEHCTEPPSRSVRSRTL